MILCGLKILAIVFSSFNSQQPVLFSIYPNKISMLAHICDWIHFIEFLFFSFQMLKYCYKTKRKIKGQFIWLKDDQLQCVCPGDMNCNDFKYVCNECDFRILESYSDIAAILWTILKVSSKKPSQTGFYFVQYCSVAFVITLFNSF